MLLHIMICVLSKIEIYKLMWLRVVQSLKNNIEVIDHKFLVSGLSYLPNDADFGIIEMALKKNFLYHRIIMML